MSRLVARPATAADYEHFARLFVELDTGNPVLPRDRWESALARDTLFFERDGEVVAYAYVQPLRGVGYVRHVVVAPSHRGRGVGGAVMRAVAAHLRGRGCARWCLNVKPDNTAAVRLYRGLGMEHAYVMTTFQLAWDAVARLPRPFHRVAARPAQPSDDVALEAAFSMPSGQIAEARGRGGLVLLCLVDPAAPDAAPLGFTSFDPFLPGAFPFRVAAPELAAPLLDAVRPHAPRAPEALLVTVEDDDTLVALLRDAGATVQLVGAHFRGEIPDVG
ncbi:N-acetyltransferase family protein [Sorangium sp. So ce1097]|uniref:GNAT family N-acetyltransferase n=1 Tax=Sorangium sp. So ce1097 TaxID=3133330 RepID=UPI003F5E4AC7